MAIAVNPTDTNITPTENEAHNQPRHFRRKRGNPVGTESLGRGGLPGLKILQQPAVRKASQ